MYRPDHGSMHIILWYKLSLSRVLSVMGAHGESCSPRRDEDILAVDHSAGSILSTTVQYLCFGLRSCAGGEECVLICGGLQGYNSAILLAFASPAAKSALKYTPQNL